MKADELVVDAEGLTPGESERGGAAEVTMREERLRPRDSGP